MFNYICILLNSMSTYKISDLENFSGIKAHTIRIWEQRYNILEPLRTETNIRLYDDEQLKKLLNVVVLINSGNKISAISKLEQVEIANRIASLNNVGNREAKEAILINQMISAGLSFDEQLFEKAFTNSVLNFGLTDAYKKVFYPMINKVGFLWATAQLNPPEEHFISNLIRQKIYAAIDALPVATNSTEKWLLFLPEKETHELGLLIANYILRSNNKEVCYLGASVAKENLIEVAKKVHPTHFLSFVVKGNQKDQAQTLLDHLARKLNSPSIYICCNSTLSKSLKFTKNQFSINSFDQFLSLH